MTSRTSESALSEQGTNQSRVEHLGRIQDKVIAQASREADLLLVNLEEAEYKLKELVAQMDRWKQEREAWLTVIAKLHEGAS